LARLESVSTEARALIGRLLTWTEGQHAGRGFDRVELERIRAAIDSEEWDTLPTLERIEARNAAEAANSPEADALAAQETAKAVKREQDQRYATEAAKARQGRRKDVTANAEEAVLLGTDTKNSGEASEADQG
jgi:type IV secretory pathway VirB10-like protein